MTLRSYVDHVRAYVSSLMPMNLGLRTPFTSGWPLGKFAAGVLYAALLIAFARLGWGRRRQPISLLVVVMIAYPFMYALSPAAWNAAEPRYALLSLPALAVLLAYPLRTPARVAVGVVVAVALTGLALARMDAHVEVMPGVVNPRHYGPLIAELDRNKVSRIYSDYWIAYRLAFETDERIIAAQSSLDRRNLRVRDGRVVASSQGWSRNWSYNRAVDNSDYAAIVFTRADWWEPKSRGLLTAHGYTRVVVGSFVVYVPPKHAEPR